MKKVFSSPLLVNSNIYNQYILRKAKQFNQSYLQWPQKISIENTVSCNATCIMCAHHDTHLTGIMTMDLFKKVVIACHRHGIKTIEFKSYGEPLLDPLFIERIQYLRNFEMNYTLVTNASLLTPATSQKILELGGLKKIQLSSNAYDPHLYKIITGNLNRDETYKNILTFLELKKEYSQDSIFTTISAVKLNINKLDIKKFTRFWRAQKGVNRVLLADLWDRLGNRKAESIGVLKNFHNPKNQRRVCKRLWECFHIYFDGQVGLCPEDHDKRKLIIGDFKKQSLEQIAFGQKLLTLRYLHLAGKRPEHPICGKCSHNSFWFP